MKLLDSNTCWETFLLNDLFFVEYGNKLDANKMTSYGQDKVAFVTRSSNNNGVSMFVDKLDDVEPYQKGCLTVALGGSIGATFVQELPFYTAQNVAVLIPKSEMSLECKLFIATVIKREADTKFIPFGRELNKYIRRNFSIKLPIIAEHQPDWQFIENYIHDIPELNSFLSEFAAIEKSSSLNDIIQSIVANLNDNTRFVTPSLNFNEWKKYKIGKLFNIEKGKRLTDADKVEGKLPFIGAIDSCNGVSSYIDEQPIHSSNVITVNYNGSVGEAFYQPVPFWASDDVNVLYPDGWELNPAIGLFICTVIRNEKYRFSYGRKWKLDRMEESEIWLPSDNDGNPDWQYMEDYIKSLPAGDKLANL